LSHKTVLHFLDVGVFGLDVVNNRIRIIFANNAVGFLLNSKRCFPRLVNILVRDIF